MSSDRFFGRPKMPQRSPEERIRDFYEVPLGLPEWAAVDEAKRCLQCKKPQCVRDLSWSFWMQAIFSVLP